MTPPFLLLLVLRQIHLLLHHLHLPHPPHLHLLLLLLPPNRAREKGHRTRTLRLRPWRLASKCCCSRASNRDAPGPTSLSVLERRITKIGVLNLSSEVLGPDEIDVLSRGNKFIPTPRYAPIESMTPRWTVWNLASLDVLLAGEEAKCTEKKKCCDWNAKKKK